jgi:hypothetical protein
MQQVLGQLGESLQKRKRESTSSPTEERREAQALPAFTHRSGDDASEVPQYVLNAARTQRRRTPRVSQPQHAGDVLHTHTALNRCFAQPAAGNRRG